MTTVKIYSAIKLNEGEKAFLRKGTQSSSVVFADELPEDTRFSHFLKSEICFGNVPPVWLKKTKRLQWLQLESVGFGEYQGLTMKSDIIITNLKGFFAVPVAETVLSGILALYRGIEPLIRYKNQKIWYGASIRSGLHILQGENILILGGGNIGQYLKKLLLAFETTVTVFDKYQPDANISDFKELDKTIPDIDILICCLPETQETIGLLNEARLTSLKNEAIVVNVGRGSVLDEKVLVGLLFEKKIRGCVLDVSEQEPIPHENLLWVCPNTILTQHTAGGYEEEITGKVRLFLKNLELFTSGNELLNMIDLAKGY